MRRLFSTTTGPAASAAAAKGRFLRSEQSFQELHHRFDMWRREHFRLLIVGGVLGSLSSIGLVYMVVREYPKTIEKFVVARTADAFSKALTFEARRKIFNSLPDVVLPEQPQAMSHAVADLLASNSNGDELVQIWANTVSQVLDESTSSFIIMTKALMRRQLVLEAALEQDFDLRLEALRQLLPFPSIERDVWVQQEFDLKLLVDGQVGARYLEANPPSNHPVPTCDLLNRILISSIAFYPGNINTLISYLDQDQVTDPAGSQKCLTRRGSVALTAQHHQQQEHRKREEERLETNRVDKVFYELHHLFRDLIANSKIRDFVLQRALSLTIETLFANQDLKRPFAMYVKAIDQDLLGPLRRDARITEDILDQVKEIFLAAPGDIQARILLTALRHPFVRQETVSQDEQASVVRDLLSAGGVVAVKLAQMLAEDPKIPENYRKLLGQLRDDNEPMSLCEFWHAIPYTVRKEIDSLGPCLGVGSVKQVHRAKFKDGSERAVCVLRRNVEDEALSSLNAMEASRELGIVAKRLGRLVYGEFNLFGEGEALGEFAQTRIGKHPLFRVVRVVHHSPKCLVEEIANGPTLAKALRPDSPYDQVKVKALLTEYHRAVFDAFVQDGLIHSDIHLGNAVLEDKGSDGYGLVLFDVGQCDKISPKDTKALLWVLSAISSPQMRVVLREVALTSLHDACLDAQPSPDKLRAKIEQSFTEAIAPFEDGTIPDQRQAYMLFLRACEKNQVVLPQGAFSVAKMIDGMISQKLQFHLLDVAEESIEKFLKKHMSWWELGSVVKGSVVAKVSF